MDKDIFFKELAEKRSELYNSELIIWILKQSPFIIDTPMLRAFTGLSRSQLHRIISGLEKRSLIKKSTEKAVCFYKIKKEVVQNGIIS